jgi:glucose-6-phosphate 1-dehydrogenase
MEPPVDFSAEEIRNEKVKVLRAIQPPTEANVWEMAARGQYGPGVLAGEPVPGYLDEPGVPPGSRTETYAALRLEIESWRWAGVPFYLRTGKRLRRKLTEIAIQLRPVPHLGFAQAGSIGAQPNQLIMSIQPDEGVSLSLAAKIPGTRMRIRPVLMQFLYGTSFLSESPEAYERLILDVMRGDATLFTRNDEVEAQWRVCDPIVHAWAASPERPSIYPAGSQGPEEAALLLRPGDAWRRI